MQVGGALNRRMASLCAAFLGALALGGCASQDKFSNRLDPKYGVAASPRVIEPGEPVPKGGGTYRVGKPYTIAGRVYVPEEDRGYRAEGVASWYGQDFHGRQTANGEVYDMHAISAAHPTLPMPSYVRVTNLANNRSLIVRVNDRGPYHANRVIDLSGKAAELLAFRGNGLARVRVEYVGPASLEGSDDRILLATLREGAPAPAPSMVRVAAARGFVPSVPDRPGAHPTPAERPYDLGSSTSRTGSLQEASMSTSRARLGAIELTAATRPGPSSPQHRPARAETTGFVPASYDPAQALTSGRGLY